jgi:hypothetical protein
MAQEMTRCGFAILVLVSGCAGVLGVDDVSYQADGSSGVLLDAGVPSNAFPRMPVQANEGGVAMLPDAFQEPVDGSQNPDASVPPDTGPDAQQDAAPDAAPDAPLDASPDALPDAPLDAPADATPDTGTDARPDTGPATECNCGGSFCPLWTMDDAGGPISVNCSAVANRTIHTCASVPTQLVGCEYAGSDVVYGYRWYCCLP